jgi:1-acyl-sn-glycerol-3-phosphate acyltransferase
MKKSIHPGKSKLVSAILKIVADTFFRLKYKVHIEVAEPIPTDVPVIIMPKHQRYVDIPLGYSAVVKASKGKHPWAIMKDSLSSPLFAGLLLKCGGIPLNRKNPEKSKSFLAFARGVLYENNILTLFPEQTRVPNKMGKGREGGFRFLVSKADKPVGVVCVGMHYVKKFLRTEVFIKIGNVHYCDSTTDITAFFHERMIELGKLSGMEYHFKAQHEE